MTEPLSEAARKIVAACCDSDGVPLFEGKELSRALMLWAAAKIKRIKRRHIGAEEPSPWSKRLERYRYDWKLRRYVLEDSSNGN